MSQACHKDIAEYIIITIVLLMDSNLQQSTRGVTQVIYSVHIYSIFYEFFQQYISIHTFFAQVDEDKS